MPVAVGCEMNVLSELAETFRWTPTSFVVEKNTGLTKLKICFLTKPPSQSIQKKKAPLSTSLSSRMKRWKYPANEINIFPSRF